MGHIASRQRSRDENASTLSSHAYKYPPKSGSYFGAHFLIGGERFEISQPETYLFGENNDLNFLGAKPVQFPYLQPSSTEPVIPLHCNVAIRRDSLKFVRVQAGDGSSSTSGGNCEDIDDHLKYHIEFIFDCDVSCTVTVYYFAIERYTSAGLQYISNRPELTSTSYRFDPGANQLFCKKDHIFNPVLYRIEELQYNPATEIAPIVIHSVAETPDNILAQSHTILAAVDRSAEGHGFVLKALKQKQFVDGVCYLMQDIYGIENKFVNSTMVSDTTEPGSSTTDGTSAPPPPTEDYAESGAECVVCMSELRDTIILPCRHLCMCSACAETLRYKASNCPICRSPFRALFQIKTIRRKIVYSRCPSPPAGRSTPNIYHNYPEFANVANRYESVLLMECLNGPIENVSGLTLPRMPRIQGAGHGQSHSLQQQHQHYHQHHHGPALQHAGSHHPSHPPHPPRVPPRRNHRRKKHVKPPVPIQEVLTPQTIVSKPEKLELTTRRIRSVVESPKLPGQMESSCDELDITYVIELKSETQRPAQHSDNENSDSSYVTPVTNESTPQITSLEFQQRHRHDVDSNQSPSPTLSPLGGATVADEEDLKSVSSREGGPPDSGHSDEDEADEAEGYEDPDEGDGPAEDVEGATVCGGGAKSAATAAAMMDDTAMSSASGASSASNKPLLVGGGSSEIKI